ncbi:hypothetical protein TKK_0018244 [Trichogramma kaykai]
MDLKLQQRTAECRIRKRASVSVEGLDLTSEEVSANKASAFKRARHSLFEAWQKQWNISETGMETVRRQPVGKGEGSVSDCDHWELVANTGLVPPGTGLVPAGTVLIPTGRSDTDVKLGAYPLNKIGFLSRL